MIDRLEHRQEVIEALTDAQKIAFAPLSFQAVAALLELGILKLIDEKINSISELILYYNCKNCKKQLNY